MIINNAVLFDEQGIYISKIRFRNTDKFFHYQGRSYNIILDKASYKQTRFFFLRFRDFYYNMGDSNPLILDKKCEPVLDPTIYNKLLLTKVVTEANELNKNGLLKYLTPTNIIIGLVVIVILVYLVTGGKLT